MAKRIRRLFSAAFMFKGRGYDPQARMAHSDAESTKIYTENHVEWVEVPHCEITWVKRDNIYARWWWFDRKL
nr:hypothetical protein [Providencia rettgeri]